MIIEILGGNGKNLPGTKREKKETPFLFLHIDERVFNLDTVHINQNLN